MKLRRNDGTKASPPLHGGRRGASLHFARAAERLHIEQSPLPKTANVKLTFTCPASLKASLDRCTALHAQAYGEAVDAEKLIPHMLEAFMAGDRGFKRTRPRNGKAAPA